MQQQLTEQPISFGGYVYDPARGSLMHGSKPIALRPKTYALLDCLARNKGRVVPKSEIMDTVWPGIFVTEDSLTQTIRELRKAMADETQELIRTVAKRGYFLAADGPTVTESPSQPVVAVLRFRNATGEAAQTPIVDGFAEDIVNGLARFGTVTVLARHSSFAFDSGDPSNWAAARSRIGANFLVEGSVRRSGSRIQVSVSLIDAENSAQLWSGQHDESAEAIFDILNDIVERVIGRLVKRIEDAGISRALRKPETDLIAYELRLRAMALLQSNDPHKFAEACGFLEAAVAKDPASGLALAELAFARVMLSGFGRSSPEQLKDALDVVVRALALAPGQPTVHRVLSFVQMYRREYGAAENHLRQALQLNPCDAECTEQMGYLLTLRGRPAEGIEWMKRAVRLNPIHPSWYMHDRAFAHYGLGDYLGAAACIELDPMPPAWMSAWLAACYAQAGDLDTARRHMARVTETDAKFSAENFARKNGAAFEHAADNQHFAEGVFLALGIAPGD